MAEDTDVILNIRAKTEDAEAKIRRLEAQLKSSAGSALTEAQGRVKRLEDQVKQTAKVSAQSFTQMAQSGLGAIAQLESNIAALGRIFTAKQDKFRKFVVEQESAIARARGQHAMQLLELKLQAIGYESIGDAVWRLTLGMRQFAGSARITGDEVKWLAQHFNNWSLATVAANVALRALQAEVTKSRPLPAGFVKLSSGKLGADHARFLEDQRRQAASGIRRTKAVPASDLMGDIAMSGADATSDLIGSAGASARSYIDRLREGLSKGAEQRAAMDALKAVGTERAGNVAAWQAAADESRLRQASDLMAKLADNTNLAGAGYQSFTSSIAAGVEAAISGSASIASAMRKAAAASLKATAVQSAVKAVEEGAWALSSLAFQRPDAAAAHALSSAKFAATAALAGAGAAALGGSGGGGAGGGGGGGGGYGGVGGGFISGSRGGEENRPIQITFQGDVTGSNAPEIVQQIESAIRTGRIRPRA